MLISVSQALLMLIDEHSENLELCSELKSLYLNGATDTEAFQKIDHYIKTSPLFDNYQVSADPTVINDDPTRRYFETHLAQHTATMAKISAEELENYLQAMIDLIPKKYINDKKTMSYLSSVLHGNIHTSKFEYQTKLKNIFKKMEAIINSQNLSPEQIVAKLNKIQDEIAEQAKVVKPQNYIEDEYKRALIFIGTTFNTYNHPQSLAKLLDKTKETIQIFNGIFDKLGKDPTFDNTGREFSSIIRMASDERAQLISLKDKILECNKIPSPEAFDRIYGLLQARQENLQNNTIKAYLSASIQMIEQAKQSLTAENYLTTIEVVLANLDKGIESCKKTYLTARCGYVSTLIALLSPNTLPFPEIYNEGFYLSMNRGRKIKDESQTSTRSDNWGLLKSFMPTAIDDIAHANKTFDFMRYVEHGEFTDALWPVHNFSKLVHPFSNSISGTMLIQARTLLALLNKNKGLSEQQAKEYFKLFTSTFVVNMGSHSLYEFTFPLSLPKIKEALHFSEDFDLNTLFWNGNNLAFEKALAATIEYNKHHLQKSLMHVQLKQGVQLKPVFFKLSADAFIEFDDSSIESGPMPEQTYNPPGRVFKSLENRKRNETESKKRKIEMDSDLQNLHTSKKQKRR